MFIFLRLKRYFSIILYFPLAVLLRLFKFHIPFFYTERIGHYLVDPDSFLKEYFLKNHKMPKAILLAPINSVCNKEASKLWKKYFFVIESPIICRILLPLSYHPLSLYKEKQYSLVIKKSAKCFAINKAWQDRDPLFSLNSKQMKLGEDLLHEIGISSNDWFVCLHNREGGYSPDDEYYHSFRNFPFEDFLLSIEYIDSLGGKCVRMGDSTMKPFNHPKLIDYATSNHKTDFLDFVLGRKAKFFIGSSSGASTLSWIFGVPVANCNMAPLTSVPLSKNDISIPMTLRDKKTKEILRLREVLKTNLADIRMTEEWLETDVELIKNTPEDILNMVKEQYERVNGIYKTDKEANMLNDQLKSAYTKSHYCYGAAAKMGDHFIKKYY